MKYKHLYIFKNRDDGYAYKEFLNYNQLYQNKESLSIHKLSFNGTDSLRITFTPNNYNTGKWLIILADSLSDITANMPALKLYEGTNNYAIKNLETNYPIIK